MRNDLEAFLEVKQQSLAVLAFCTVERPFLSPSFEAIFGGFARSLFNRFFVTISLYGTLLIIVQPKVWPFPFAEGKSLFISDEGETFCFLISMMRSSSQLFKATEKTNLAELQNLIPIFVNFIFCSKIEIGHFRRLSLSPLTFMI